MKEEVKFITKGQEPKKDLFRSCRRMIVGPWVNQPEHYDGYNGFVGWAGINRLKSGRWNMTFTSGYWHGSPPMTPEILEDEMSRSQYEEWHKIGMPNIYAPNGGRIHVIHSDDKGKTWSKPEVLANSNRDDRHPTILELNDGTLLCTYFEAAFRNEINTYYMRSTDNGKTWSTKKEFPENSNRGFGNGSAIQLQDGKVVCCVGSRSRNGKDEMSESLNICASDDMGESFYLISKIKDIEGNQGSSETGICELEDGRIILLSRRLGPVYWSEDKGKTWSEPKTFGVDIYDPHLLLFPNGVLACFHGSYKGGGLRVILSKDNGKTWHGPKEGIGYSLDPSVYGYCHPMLLEDGSAYVTYLHTGGHTPNDARTQAIWGLRVKPHDDAGGIDILPAPGSPKDMGLKFSEVEGTAFSGGDAELGNLF